MYLESNLIEITVHLYQFFKELVFNYAFTGTAFMYFMNFSSVCFFFFQL